MSKKLNGKEVMEELRAELSEGFRWIDLDPTPDSQDSWSRDYAIMRVSIVEPEDTRYFDIDRYRQDLITHIGNHFPGVPVVRERRASSPAPGRQGLHVRVMSTGWEVELEYMRMTKEKAEKAKKPKAK